MYSRAAVGGGTRVIGIGLDAVEVDVMVVGP